MRRILATACGGPSTLSFTRSLRDADSTGSNYYIVGTDSDKFNIHRAEVDKSYLVPPATDPDYIPFIKYIVETEGIDFLHTQPEFETYTVGRHRDEILATGCSLFMPPQETIELLRDKAKSYKVWKEAGIGVPDTMDIHSVDDLKAAFDRFGQDIWIRETIGAAGKGSLSRPTFGMALGQIERAQSWGRVVASRHLTKDTTTWQSIWKDGKLVVAQGRRRLNWAFANRAQSGVTGLTGVGLTVTDPELDQLATRCILAAAPRPHGIFSVDLAFDEHGVPNPTEINIGKFFTTHHFLTRTGCNMPHILVQLAFDEYDGSYNVLNPCEPGCYWIRGIDHKPVLIREEDVSRKHEIYCEQLREVRSGNSLTGQGQDQ